VAFVSKREPASIHMPTVAVKLLGLDSEAMRRPLGSVVNRVEGRFWRDLAYVSSNPAADGDGAVRVVVARRLAEEAANLVASRCPRIIFFNFLKFPMKFTALSGLESKSPFVVRRGKNERVSHALYV
jgi:hypothetical protein